MWQQKTGKTAGDHDEAGDARLIRTDGAVNAVGLRSGTTNEDIIAGKRRLNAGIGRNNSL